jgi:hypothetical protein
MELMQWYFFFQLKSRTSLGTIFHLPQRIHINSLDENYAFIILKEGICKTKSVVPIFKLENVPHQNALGIIQPSH